LRAILHYDCVFSIVYLFFIPTTALIYFHLCCLSQPKSNQKSLKQREAEYAEARLRILGSCQQPQPAEAAAPKQQPGAAAIATNGPKNSTNNSNGGGRAPTRNSLPRMPRGPDGTKGFQQAR
jgi:hypothetical protein